MTVLLVDTHFRIASMVTVSGDNDSNVSYLGFHRPVGRPFGSCGLLPWSCKDSSPSAADSWFPIDEGECHDTRTGDPEIKHDKWFDVYFMLEPLMNDDMKSWKGNEPKQAIILYLEHFVWRRFDSRNHACRIKSTLLYVCKVVARVAIKHHLSNRYQRVVRMWPDLSKEGYKLKTLDVLL